MKELLSNDEIDTLLELFRAESGASPAPAVEPAGPDAPAAAAASPLDLLRPNRFGRERLLLLERLFAAVAKAVGAALAERLRVDLVCDCAGVEQVRFAPWRRQLDGPVGIWTVAMPPFASPVLLTLTGDLLCAAVDRLLGGSGRAARAREHFTAAELTVAEALVETLVERAAAALADVVRVAPRIEARSGNPAMVQAMAPTDVAIAVQLRVTGEVLRGELRLLVAYEDLEPYLDRVPAARDGAAGGLRRFERDAVERCVADLPVRLSVELGRAALPLRGLLALRPGDVVRLDRLAGEPLDALVEGVGRFCGEVVGHGVARTFRIRALIGRDGDERR